MSTATQSRKSSLEPLFREASVGSSRAIAALAVSLEPRVRVRVTPLSENLDRQLAGSQVGAIIAGVLGALALTLASVGVFGVFAYVVQQRTHEIGIRMALGARSFFIGLGIGLVGAVAGSRLI